MEPEIKSRSVSLDETLWQKIDAKVKKEYGDNRSAYFRELVEANLSAFPLPTTGSPLADLAKAFNPPRAETLAVEGAKWRQSIIISRLLEALDEALKNTDFNPERPFQLFNSTGQLIEFLKQGELSEKFKLIHDAVTELSVAEEQTKYKSKLVRPKT